MKRILILSSVFFFLSSVFAVKTERWEVKSSADFMRGKLQCLTVSSDTELRLGYAAQKLGEFAKEIWCSTVAPDGTIYFGTGSPADVFAVSKEGKTVKVCETDGVSISAMVCDDKGNLLIATLPEGKILKVGPDHKPKEFCRLRSPYVWALLPAKDGSLFAGAGPDGKLYRISPDGKADEWYTVEDSNILCLAFDPDGTGALLAGGSDRGLLYRIAAKGKGTVLHEFVEDEVKAINVSGQNVFIAVNKQKARRSRVPSRTHRPSAAEFEDLGNQLTAEYGANTPDRVTRSRDTTPPETRLANLLAGALYLYTANGRVDRWANWDNESIHTIAHDADGAILLAMAGHGHIYRVTDAQHWELLFDFEEKQALTLALRDGRLAFVGTGNIGNAYMIATEKAASGEYTSEVHDCRFLSTWGKLYWHSDGAVTVATRTGNTALPDSTWSPWSAPISTAPTKITSPRGRYIQLRGTLTRDSNPCLRSLTLHLQIQNQRPEITSLEVGEKTKSDKPATALAITPTAADKAKPEIVEPSKPPIEEFRPKLATPIRRFAWHARDKDGDTLVYRLYYRAEDDEVWIPMLRGKPLRATEFSWDTDSIPDGWYRVKVVASDEECNPVSDALTDAKISEPFKVNNSRPVVTGLAFDVATGTLRGVARSKLSLIRFLEYNVDGSEWRFFAPTDGVFDDREAAFSVKLHPTLTLGPHTIAVRAIDEDGNTGVEKTTVKLSP